MTALLSFFPGKFTRLTPLSTFKELLKKGDLDEIWRDGFTGSEFIRWSSLLRHFWVRNLAAYERAGASAPHHSVGRAHAFYARSTRWSKKRDRLFL